MALTNNQALTRQTKCFVKLESTYGELAFPAATDVLAVLGVPKVTQEDQFVDSKEIVESRSKPARTWTGVGPGNWNLQVYARPSGTPGTPPQESALVEAALGAKAINAGASVVYTPALVLPSLSLCFREGHTWHFVSGAKVAELKANLTKKDLVTLDFSGQFQKVVRAGTSETVAGSTTSLISLSVGDAALFDVGARVQVGGENNTAAGYTITAVDDENDTITISPALAEAPAAGVAVTGYLPTGSLAGHTVSGAEGTLTLAGATITITGFDGSIANALNPDEDEIAPAGFITAIDEGTRSASGTINARFRRTYAGWFRRARSQTQGAVVVSAGSVAGKRFGLSLPYAVLNTPSTDGDEIRRTISVGLVGLASGALENEVTITYS